MKNQNGKNEYLVSDPRLTVEESAACRKIVAAAQESLDEWKADAQKQKPVRHLVASITEPFGLGKVFAEEDVAVIRPKRSGDGRVILSRVTGGDSPTAAELNKATKFECVFRHDGGWITVDQDGVTVGVPTVPLTESTPPQPTEAELLAAELAKPPRGVSVEQWRAYVASRSEGPSGERIVIHSSDLVTWRNGHEEGGPQIPDRILRGAPVAKRNWWE